MTLLPT